MACPYFMPLVKLENGTWPHPARLPLGGGWSGHCTAPGHEGELPAQDILQQFCNLGYADGCSWAPRQRAWDAVRFALIASTKPANFPAGNGGQVLGVMRIRFVCERDHRPIEHGDLEFDIQRTVWLRRHDDARVQKMAECFVEPYLKKPPSRRTPAKEGEDKL